MFTSCTLQDMCSPAVRCMRCFHLMCVTRCVLTCCTLHDVCSRALRYAVCVHMLYVMRCRLVQAFNNNCSQYDIMFLGHQYSGLLLFCEKHFVTLSASDFIWHLYADCRLIMFACISLQRTRKYVACKISRPSEIHLFPGH